MELKISFPDKKTRQRCYSYLRKFTRENAFLMPSSTEEYSQLYRERGLSMQYRADKSRTFFPTPEGWYAFVEFARNLHLADPFATHSTINDTHQAVQRAFANMLSADLLPETVEDLVAYLPYSFKRDLSARAERRFSKVQGINVTDNHFFRIGQCWLGRFGGLCFDAIPETLAGHKKHALEAVKVVFDEDSAVLAAARNLGTADRIKEESTYQWDFALSALCVLVNLTYQSVFDRLWQVRILDRPEYGLATQRSFSIIEQEKGMSERQVSYSTTFVEQWFDINTSIINEWHDSLGLGIFNRIGEVVPSGGEDLARRMVNAILYFRVAASQSTPEMQLSTLWICVESFFTVNNPEVLKANSRGLITMVTKILQRDHWPRRAQTPEELRKAFAKFYGWRSRTLHHGQRGHVSWRDVQDFSVVVGVVIVGVAYLMDEGVRTVKELVVKTGVFSDPDT